MSPWLWVASDWYDGRARGSLILWAMGLLFFAGAYATSAVPSTALMTWSFDICSADVLCSTLAFPVNGDYTLFSQMMLAWLARRIDGGVDMVIFYEGCVIPFPFPPASACSDQWLWEMRGAQACDINEEWIEGVGCQCIEGRNCALDCIHLSSS